MSPLREIYGWSWESMARRYRNELFIPKKEISLTDMAALERRKGSKTYLCGGGVVWDVTEDEAFEPGGVYEIFANKDGSTALGRMSLDAEEANNIEDWSELDESERQVLQKWVKYFDDTYWRAGVLREWVRNETWQDVQARFLLENSQRPGVVVMASGLQFEVLRPPQSAGDFGRRFAVDEPADLRRFSVDVRLEGRRFDNFVFTSGLVVLDGDEPSSPDSLKRLPKGCHAVLSEMREGEKRRLFVPAALGYGAEGRGYGKEGQEPLIHPHSALVFDVEVLRVLKPVQKKSPVAPPSAATA